MHYYHRFRTLENKGIVISDSGLRTHKAITFLFTNFLNFRFIFYTFFCLKVQGIQVSPFETSQSQFFFLPNHFFSSSCLLSQRQYASFFFPFVDDQNGTTEGGRKKEAPRPLIGCFFFLIVWWWYILLQSFCQKNKLLAYHFERQFFLFTDYWCLHFPSVHLISSFLSLSFKVRRLITKERIFLKGGKRKASELQKFHRRTF